MRASLLLVLLGRIALAAPALSVVQDTLYKADGSRFDGIAQIEWKSFRTANGTEIPQNTLQVRVMNGNLNVALAPTTNALKPVYYTVRFNTEGRTQFTEYWSVPQSAAPLKLNDVRSLPISTPQPGNLTALAVQDVSGLRTELDLRPIRGAGYIAGRTAVIGANGGVEAAIGEPGHCVHVDGTAGPCGTGASGGGTGVVTHVDAERPSGTIDGVNTAFQLSAAPVPAGSLLLYRNGILQAPGTSYTLSGASVTFTSGNAPQQGDQLAAWYRMSADSAYTFADLEVPSGAVNGSNTIFTLSAIPLPASSLMLYRNGVLQKAEADFTLSLDRITFLPASVPQSGDLVQATYRK